MLNNFYPLAFHSPLVFDIGTQTTYRKPGYVAWPKTSTVVNDGEEKIEKQKNKGRNTVYFAYPKK